VARLWRAARSAQVRCTDPRANANILPTGTEYIIFDILDINDATIEYIEVYAPRS